MNPKIVWRVLSLVALTAALSGHGFAQGQAQVKFGGLINDYTPVIDAGGPWHVVGEWSLALKGNSGRGDFSVALSMVRADNLTRSSHTHHIIVTDGEVTALANGYRISGTGVITGNGNLSGISGSPVDMVVTGGNTVAYSNVSVTFGGAAVGHFGSEPLDGVVTDRR